MTVVCSASWRTTGVERAVTVFNPILRFHILPAKEHFFRVGDAGIEPATSAV